MRKLIMALLIGVCCGMGYAGDAVPVAEDPVIEARVQSLSELLRCLVCQNQNLADSHADLAIDLKNQVRDMLKQGQSEKEIIDYMVQRYGDFVLYRPPLKSTTWLLWGGPFVLFGLGLFGLFMHLRRRHKTAAVPLSEGEHGAAVRLLNGEFGDQK